MPRASLQSSLDREIYQVVRKYQEDKPESELKTHLVYNYIQRSNSALKRRPKNVMETSIDRVIDVIKQDDEDDDSEDDVEFAMSDSFAPKSGGSTPRPINRPIGKTKRVNSEAPKREEQPAAVANGAVTKKRKQRHDTEPEDHKARSAYRLEDLGGVENIIEQLESLLVLPLLRPQKYTAFNIPIPRGILLHGPPGCGKTMISRAFAARMGVPFVEILGPSIVSGMSGESEQKLREKFEEAKRLAPCLIFIDEIDVIAPKRESSQSQMEKRIVAQLLISMDGISLNENDGKPVIVLASTNRPDSLDPALRRGGRFDTEIMMGVPNEGMREHILRAQMRNVPVSIDLDFKKLAKMTAGFVGADLADMVGKAGSWRMAQYRAALKQELVIEADMEVDDPSVTGDVLPLQIQQLDRLILRAKDTTTADPPGFETLTINMAAFLAVLPTITPSSKREGFATIPDTTWEDIGALEGVREELVRAVVHPIAMPGQYAAVGIKPPTGVLLWGPPGCGKTLLAKAVANESKANFISVKGPELFNKVSNFISTA
jgi:ribosome biogenesis ATPase